MIEIINKTTINIIEILSKQPSYIRELAENLQTSPGYIHKLINSLKKNGFIYEKKVKNRKFIYLADNPLLNKIRSLINIEKITNSKNFKKLSKFGKVGIYGSFAQGTDDENSDIDLWIYTKKPSLNLQEIIRQLEKELNNKINLLIFNKEKLTTFKKTDPEFYLRLKLTSYTNHGDIFD